MKKKNNNGLKFLGKEDIFIGVFLMLAGFLISLSSNILVSGAGIVILLIGLVLVSFGIGDYLRS